MTDITKATGKELGAELAKRISEGGGKLTLIGFGSFKVVQRPERNGRNPATGAALVIPAHETTRFKPSKA